VTIGEKIKELREAKGLKQWELADLIGSYQSQISGWESSLCEPNIFNCILLADFFNVSLDELVCRDFKGGKENVNHICNTNFN
jgi:transcriptional regulator with XRE-family HTH domain